MRKFGRRLFVTSIILTCTTAVTGCWDMKDISEVSPVLGIGIDEGENGTVDATFQIPGGAETGSEQGSMGKQGTSRIIEGVGSTFELAIQDAQTKTSRTLLFQHNMVLLFSDSYAKKRGIGEILSYTERSHDFRENELIAVTDEKPKDIVAQRDTGEYVNAQFLRQLTKKNELTVVSTELRFVNDILSPSHAAFTAWIGKSSSGNPRISGLAVFRGDKLITLIPHEQCQGFLWPYRSLRNVDLELRMPRSNGVATVRVVISKPKIQFEGLQQNVPVYDIRVGGMAQIKRAPRGTKIDSKFMSKIRESIRERLTHDIDVSVAKLQERGVDAEGFGNAASRQNPIIWKSISKQWSTIFPKVVVKPNITFTVIRSGMTKNNVLDYFDVKN